jgi:hypothetical protein
MAFAMVVAKSGGIAFPIWAAISSSQRGSVRLGAYTGKEPRAKGFVPTTEAHILRKKAINSCNTLEETDFQVR